MKGTYLHTLCLLLLPACGNNALSNTIIIANISGVSADTRTLRATSYLNGKREQDPAEEPADQIRLAIRLPTGALGTFRLEVDALGVDQCSSAVGQAETALNGEGRIDLSVVLSPLPIRACLLSVTKTGHGVGWVNSDPAGILCQVQDEKCFAQFAQGTTVQLMANPEIHTLFDGWSMGCAGSGPCMVLMGGPTYVTATFSVKTDPLGGPW